MTWKSIKYINYQVDNLAKHLTEWDVDKALEIIRSEISEVEKGYKQQLLEILETEKFQKLQNKLEAMARKSKLCSECLEPIKEKDQSRFEDNLVCFNCIGKENIFM